MKKILIKQILKNILIGTLIFIFSTYVFAIDKKWVVKQKLKKNIYFQIKDLKDDDKGPGYYTYPLARCFEQGIFDITKFTVENHGKNVWFRVEFREPIIPSWQGQSGDNGWLFQLIDIYIDKDQKPNSGFTWTLPGRHINFAKDSAWDVMVLLSPIRREKMIDYIKNKTERMEVVNNAKKILIPTFYKVYPREIIGIVPKKELGEPKPSWGYQVFSLGFNYQPLTNQEDRPDRFHNLEVYSFANEYYFGGGTDWNGDPNVIDILTPPGISQYKLLRNYESHTNPRLDVYPVISHIYRMIKPKPKKLNITYKNYTKIIEELEKKRKEIEKISKLARQIKEMKSNPVKLIGKPEIKKESSLRDVKSTAKLTDKDKCIYNMKIIFNAAMRYRKEHPEDRNITLLDLLTENYLKSEPRCPSGGRYAIYGENEKYLKVRCFNPTGVEHGIWTKH